MARPKRKDGGKDTPLDQQKIALSEKERLLRQKMEEAQKFIIGAPQKKEALERKRREELVSRGSSHLRRLDATTLLDRRNFHLQQETTRGDRRRQRPLKSQRKQERLKFFGLCIILALLIIWACSRFM